MNLVWVSRRDIEYFKKKKVEASALFDELLDLVWVYRDEIPDVCLKIAEATALVNRLADYWQPEALVDLGSCDEFADYIIWVGYKLMYRDQYTSDRLMQAGNMIYEMLERYDKVIEKGNILRLD